MQVICIWGPNASNMYLVNIVTLKSLVSVRFIKMFFFLKSVITRAAFDQNTVKISKSINSK